MTAEVIQGASGKLHALHANLCTVIEGKSEVLAVVVKALAAGGSVLLEDVPGVGKTTLAKAIAKSIQAKFNRIQFTPDLLPADILGASIYNPSTGAFAFHPGPVFCNMLLADETNRASPRTQSALLEAMSEHQATIEGTCYPLEDPFFVLATQNPMEFHGTYPLPEAQLDRFLVQISLGYPSPEHTHRMLDAQRLAHPLDTLEAVMNGEELGDVMSQIQQVTVEESLTKYMVNLVEATRLLEGVKLGASPRGALMLYRAAQSAALYAGRDHVLPDDIQEMAPYVLAHRIMLTSKAKYSGVGKGHLVAKVVEQTAVPV